MNFDIDGHLHSFAGELFGKTNFNANEIAPTGELVFQTGMVGYPESLTDPSYHNQILVLTYPLIGNYGVPDAQVLDAYGIGLNVESSKVHVKALVVGEYVNTPSHHTSRQTLDAYLKENGVTGIQGIDTRRLTQLIRDHGTLRACITKVSPQALPPGWSEEHTRLMSKLSWQVSTPELRVVNPQGEHRVLIIDCGIKNNQLRELCKRNAALFIVGIGCTDFREVFEQNQCQYLFISNGPGDPRECTSVVNQLHDFMFKHHPEVPVFGICFGHQLLGLAAGFKVEKMKFGNRGHNQPCQLLGSDRTFQTTQNHGYAVNYESQLQSEWQQLFINLNDHTNEGLYWRGTDHRARCFSVQFHPEAKAGPEDTSFLFDVFLGTKSIDDEEFAPHEYRAPKRSKVLVLGSGGLCIGQSGEFDYSGSQGIKAFKEEGLTVVLVNPNVATVQTTPGFVDRVYFLPVQPNYVEQIIEAERPDCIALSFGGQSALNCGIQLRDSGVLDKYDIEVLGTPVDSIVLTEDRDAFKLHIESIGERVPNGRIAHNIDEAMQAAEVIGYPVLVRAAFTLGGQGSGFANNREELTEMLVTSFAASSQVILDKSIRGWKEVEYEIVRDRFGNCISVCNMENLDPLGVHTGESIVVAPSQTLSDNDYNRLRTTALRTVASLGIVGECNIQYALDPHSDNYYIIEINARLSRSSALASKATGYPLAYVAAKLGLGYKLSDLRNNITGTTNACSEPSLDYCVVKIPRWDLRKFQRVNPHIGTAMKSVGEGMAISRSFEEALQSALRMTGMCRLGLLPGVVPCTDDELRDPTYRRILAVATGLANGSYSIDRMYELSGIDRWFLTKIDRIVKMGVILRERTEKLDALVFWQAKRLGFSDAAIAHHIGSTELVVRADRLKSNVRPTVNQIDTVAAEFPCATNYLYTTYAGGGEDSSSSSSITATTTILHAKKKLDNSDEDILNANKVLVLGGGVYHIGSSVEFDWCAVSCIRELREQGKQVIVVNCNPETVSTDYDEADTLYFCEVSLETVLDIYEREQPAGVIVSVGGQLPNNIAMGLHRQGVPILGTSAENIDRAENRKHFSRMLDRTHIDQPQWKELDSVTEALAWSQSVGYPVLVRPSYVLSGAAMNVAYEPDDLRKFLGAATEVSPDHPVVISKFLIDAKEIELDAVAENGVVKLIAISEHVENAGVHSGDATLIFPAQDLTKATTTRIEEIGRTIAKELEINGPFNIQFIAKDDRVGVIECNLRVSRSLPFVSKTLGVNFVAKATQAIMGLGATIDWCETAQAKATGVKVPQFSFNRLTGAEILLGVEMQSTGEVACYGERVEEAYLKALLASGFFHKSLLPHNGNKVLLSIGGFAFKEEFRQSVSDMRDKLALVCYGTKNTADFYDLKELTLESDTREETIINWIAQRKFAFIVNITERNKLRSTSDSTTDGYRMRQAATKAGIPVVTDIKSAKLLVRSLCWLQSRRQHELDYFPVQGWDDTVDAKILVNQPIDCFTEQKLVRIPGLIDVHVHVREPGETQKEDWDSCTRAALAGGITMICAMPNTNPALCTAEDYEVVEALASAKAHCDYALFAGASATNMDVCGIELSEKCAGLKMYLNNTHGPLLLDDVNDWDLHARGWNHPVHPICVHAEGTTLAAAIHVVCTVNKRRLHVCHVSSATEILLVRQAKLMGLNITCEVSPHHLFVTDTAAARDFPKERAVKPPLQSSKDVEALWDNMKYIDCFATDHAPHLRQEKHEGWKDDKPGCPGFPGLETALPLLLTAVHEGRLTLDDIVLRYHTNPKRIFGLPDQPDTYVELDMNHRYTIPERTQQSKCGWTPFVGQQCVGAIKRVVFRGSTVYTTDNSNTLCGRISIDDQTPKGQNIRLLNQRKSAIREAMRACEATSASIKFADPAHGSPIIGSETYKVQQQQQQPSLQINNTPKLRLPRHLLSSQQFTKDSLRAFFEYADAMRKADEMGSLEQRLTGKTIGLFFCEPSTRTRVSFEVAMKRLGGNVVNVTDLQSSVQKGETIEDSVVSLQACGQLDALVFRHRERGAAAKAAAVCGCPVINAGDGDGEHPTQTLIDLYTIRRELGSVGRICVAFIGDLRYGRTVHSLAKALALRGEVRLHYIAPKQLQIPDDIYSYVHEAGVQQFQHTELTDEVLAVADVLYVTRLQRERYESQSTLFQTKEPYIITPAVLAKAKPDVRVMHPFPRGAEISTETDNDPRAAYKRQMENGPYVRMALLTLMLKK